MAESRRAATTKHIRNVAIANILGTGVRAMSLNAVSTEAFVSIGAVYERWENKTAALTDLARSVIGPELKAVLNSTLQDDVAGLERLFTDPAAIRAQQLLVEMLFASYEDPELLPVTSDLINQYLGALQQYFDASELGASLATWSASTLLGNALLRLGGADVPDIAGEVTQGLVTASQYVVGGQLPRVVGDVLGLMPETPIAAQLDSTGERIRAATKSTLEDATLMSTRDVASLAGVTTGALYRRFGSKSDLINDVLISELQPARYAWAHTLIETWQTAENTDAVADVIAAQFITALSNSGQVNMLLQITSQARSDENVRRMLVGQVENVAATRAAMFAIVASTGVFAPFVTPEGQAWLLQATPTGARLLSANGLGPTCEQITLAIRAIAAAFIAN